MSSHTAALLGQLRRLTYTPLADAELLRRWVERRDQEAFTALVSRHGRMVHGVCRRVLGNTHDAEDAFQAVFLILARKAAALRHPEALSGWLHGVAFRLALKARTAASRRPSADPISSAAEPRDPHPDPLDTLSARELLTLIDREIARLPEVYRLPLVLCDLEERTQEEAARLLGWTLGSLRGRLMRGRARLKSRWARRGLTLPVGIGFPLLPAALTASSQAAVPVLAPQTIADASRCAVRFAAQPATAEVPARAAELARDGLRILMLGKVKNAAAMVVMMSVCLAGAGLMVPQLREEKFAEERREDKTPPSGKPAPKPTTEKLPVRLDRFGDPLPEGAVARLGTVRFRHGYVVSSVAFSPDRKTLASGGWDTVHLWEIATGKEIRRFTAGTGTGVESIWVQSIAFSPDGKFLAAGTGSGPCEVVIWEIATGKESPRLRDNPRSMTSIAFSPDGKTLAAGTDTPDPRTFDALIHVWDAGTGRLLHQFKGHREGIASIAFSPDGKTLASASQDKTIRLWDLATGKELRQFKGHTDKALAVAYSPDGKMLASGSKDNTIRVWDVGAGAEHRVLKGHGGAVTSVVFFADGKKLASSSWDKSIRLWDTTTGQELRQMHGHHDTSSSIALSPDGETLASGGVRTVRLWNLAKGQELRPTRGHHYGLSCIAISPDGEQIASGDEAGEVWLWESATGKEVRPLQSKFPWLIDRLDFSLNGEILRVASWGARLLRWETATGKLIDERRYKGIPFLTSDSKFVVSNNFDGTIFLQETVTAETIREFKTQKQLGRMAVSPDGKFLAAGSPGQDGTVVLWELATGKQRCRCQGAYDQVGALAFSPDGKYLVGTTTRSRMYTPQSPVHLWDAATGREVRQFQGHDSAFCFTFSPDSRTLASAGQKTIRLWETATGKKRGDLTGHQGYIRSLAFSPDGMRLASASYDTTALVWDLTGRLTMGKKLGAPLSAEELETHWKILADEAAPPAFRAIQSLAADPAHSIPYLRTRLHPIALADEKRLKQWIADLDSEQFTVREKAASELEKLGAAALHALRKSLDDKPALETRRRLEQLIEKQERAEWSPSLEHLRIRRALEVLERMGTPEAKEVLTTLANGAPGAWLTLDAKAALTRLAQRPAGNR